MVLLVSVMLMVTFTQLFQMLNRVLFLMAAEIFGDISNFSKIWWRVYFRAVHIFA